MVAPKTVQDRIPVSISLSSTLEAENIQPRESPNKKRMLIVSGLAILIGVVISFVAKFLVYLIELFTAIAFHGSLAIEDSSPADNELGLWVIFVPVAGGLIVGVMALYGSKAIRGHGIPEAMEQILTNKSKIKPAIAYLKPLSSAIAIGTGGPFGAEGPIIATGGAIGSTVGQTLRVTHNERKILLASGATAGMAAIFGSPIAAIFLALELLLFEFSPRSIIPVSLACVTGAAGHHLLFESGPVFEIHEFIPYPSNTALFIYSMMGLVIGLLSVLVTKIVYYVEDHFFEKLPIHWMWWPALGGLGVGIIGYFAPRTLGVGYENITDILSGNISMNVILSLCVLKFISWAIALGSGTSGGTLAPLLTIGSAIGALMGSVVIYLFPASGVILPLAALVGMAAMFAGSSRALFTSIVFALETTGQYDALLPLLATCSASYVVSFFLMKNTIMTEKIARRGVKTPHSYEPDILEKITVEEVMEDYEMVMMEDSSIEEARMLAGNPPVSKSNQYYIVSNRKGEYQGILSYFDLFNNHHSSENPIRTIIKNGSIFISKDSSLRTAVERMAVGNVYALPVLSNENNTATIVGIISSQDIVGIYKHDVHEFEKVQYNLKDKIRNSKFFPLK